MTHWHNPKPHIHHLGISYNNRESNDQWNTCWCLTKSNFSVVWLFLEFLAHILHFWGPKNVKRSNEAHGNYIYTTAILSSFCCTEKVKTVVVRLCFFLYTQQVKIFLVRCDSAVLIQLLSRILSCGKTFVYTKTFPVCFDLIFIFVWLCSLRDWQCAISSKHQREDTVLILSADILSEETTLRLRLLLCCYLFCAQMYPMSEEQPLSRMSTAMVCYANSYVNSRQMNLCIW